MISPKRLLELARKWKMAATLGKKSRLSSKIDHGDIDSQRSNEPLIASKGHFVVYTIDRKRFEFPLTYLNSNVFRELFRTSEELFGFPRSKHITLPCDAIFMEFIIAFLENHLSKNVENALLYAISHYMCCSATSFAGFSRT